MSVGIDSAPMLTHPSWKVAEKAETSPSLVIKAPQDNTYPTFVCLQTPIYVMDLGLRMLANIRVTG